MDLLYFLAAVPLLSASSQAPLAALAEAVSLPSQDLPRVAGELQCAVLAQG